MSAACSDPFFMEFIEPMTQQFNLYAYAPPPLRRMIFIDFTALMQLVSIRRPT